LLAAKDLHVSDGRDTEALDCKPITNLKENIELSNLHRTSSWRKHAVISGINIKKIEVNIAGKSWLFVIFTS
jgi:hypothetical protein